MVQIGIPTHSFPLPGKAWKLSSSMPLIIQCSPEIDFSLFWGRMASKEVKIITFESLDGFKHLRCHFGVVFLGQSNGDIILGIFHTFWGWMASKEAKTVTFEPLDGFQQLRGHFGVVFWGQFNADIILGRSTLFWGCMASKEAKTPNSLHFKTSKA